MKRLGRHPLIALLLHPNLTVTSNLEFRIRILRLKNTISHNFFNPCSGLQFFVVFLLTDFSQKCATEDATQKISERGWRKLTTSEVKKCSPPIGPKIGVNTVEQNLLKISARLIYEFPFKIHI